MPHAQSTAQVRVLANALKSPTRLRHPGQDEHGGQHHVGSLGPAETGGQALQLRQRSDRDAKPHLNSDAMARVVADHSARSHELTMAS